MKKLKIIFGILIAIVVGFFAVKFILGVMEDARVKKIKEGWHIEIVNDYIKVRKEPDRNSSELGEVKKGKVYKVDDYENHNGNFWYHVEYEKGKWGWVANPVGKDYLNDTNNEDDIKAPTIKFNDAVYYVDSIEDINYDHIHIDAEPFD